MPGTQGGLQEGQVVRCKVTAHRDRYGVDVEIVDPPGGGPAFIDFVLLAERGVPMPPENFPPVGEVREAIVVGFTPKGELRLDARPSRVADRKSKNS